MLHLFRKAKRDKSQSRAKPRSGSLPFQEHNSLRTNLRPVSRVESCPGATADGTDTVPLKGAKASTKETYSDDGPTIPQSPESSQSSAMVDTLSVPYSPSEVSSSPYTTLPRDRCRKLKNVNSDSDCSQKSSPALRLVGSGALKSCSLDDLDRVCQKDERKTHSKGIFTRSRKYKHKDKPATKKQHQKMKQVGTGSPVLPKRGHEREDEDDGHSTLKRSCSFDTMHLEERRSTQAHKTHRRQSSHFNWFTWANKNKDLQTHPIKSSPVLSKRQSCRLRKVGSYRELPRRRYVYLEDTDGGNNTLARSCSVDALDEFGQERHLSHSATASKSNHHPPRRHDSPSYHVKSLRRPKGVEAFAASLLEAKVDVNTLDEVTGEALIHSIMRRRRKERPELLLSLLTNSNAYVDLKTRKGMTALHLAVEEGCEVCVKVLVLFCANINEQGYNEFTPLDLAIDHAKMPNIEALLMELGAKSSAQLMHRRTFTIKVPSMQSYAQHDVPPARGQRLRTNDRLNDYIIRRGTRQLHSELELNISRIMSHSSSFGSVDEAIAIANQQKELVLYNKTLRVERPKLKPTAFGLQGGSRILFLDGGGIKGLIEIEVLMQIERLTERRITDLFDWIVGTSTGGIIALGLVYAQKSLNEIRQLYLKIRNKVFAKPRLGFAYCSETLEELLKETFDPSMVMSDVSHPKVLIAAVNKASTPLELHFFNNCFGDEHSEQLVWKVARYTSAAPMFFTEFENYVDGGILANNPSESGLTAIQNFYRLEGKKLPIALVVSIGTGVYPAEELGKVDAQDFLFFGKHWLNLDKLRRRAQNLMSLLSNALVESETVARNCRSRCDEQSIPFYRFSPKLEEVIPAGETDLDKLLNMVMQARVQTPDQGLRELIDLFRIVAEASKRLNPNFRDAGEEELREDDEEENVEEERDDTVV